jgi:hypothetical protein
MNINLSQLTPYLWILAIILAVVLAFVIIRFFWQHILKYIVHGCLGFVGILALLAMLHYIFKIF